MTPTQWVLGSCETFLCTLLFSSPEEARRGPEGLSSAVSKLAKNLHYLGH